MRLFTALDLPPDILPRLEQLLAALQPEAPIRWSPLENLHITIKFIGEWPEERLDKLDAALQPLGSRPPFEVTIQNLGWFPNSDSPRTFWAGVQAGDSLTNLAADTDETLARAGVPKDPHAYSPHLTLARIKNSVPLQRLRAKARELAAAPIAKFRASRFFLYRSAPGSTSSIYQKLRTYPFES